MRTIPTPSLIAILLSLSTSTAMCQQSGFLQKENANTTWYIFADVPTLCYSPDKSYMECNLIQGFGGGFECLFNGRAAIGFNLYHENLYINFKQNHFSQISKGWRLTPTFKLYLDSYKKLSLNIGTQILLYQETINSEGEENSQDYWQNTIRLGAGYKMYLFKKKKLGTEVFIGSNLLMWGNSEPWTTALSRRGLIIEGTVFYKFTKNNRK